jgi:NTE family protein
VTVAFALSGGGNLGPMQAGGIAALLEHGITPDVLVGSSVGALNAAFLATRPGLGGAQDLLTSWLNLRRTDVARFSPLTIMAGFLGRRDHLVSSSRLRSLIRQWIQIERLEEAGTPLAIVATDALTGTAVTLQRGDVIRAISASAAIPGLLPAVQIEGRWLIDGGLSAGCPVLQAQALGADEVYMITTATSPRVVPPRGAVAMAMNSVSLVTARSNQEQLALARHNAGRTGGHVFVVPTGEPPAPGPFDLSRGQALASLAYENTVTWLGERHPDRSDTAVSDGPGALAGSRFVSSDFGEVT